ncbi:MAG: hypothetical protein GY884_04490 [Proteobacteria bacterium]|nr:hypothetical protein [Pseudomonadota bacterium]
MLTLPSLLAHPGRVTCLTLVRTVVPDPPSAGDLAPPAPDAGAARALALAAELDTGNWFAGITLSLRSALSLHDAHVDWAAGIADLEEDQGRDTSLRVLGLAAVAGVLWPDDPVGELADHAHGRALVDWLAADVALSLATDDDPPEDDQPLSGILAFHLDGLELPEALAEHEDLAREVLEELAPILDDRSMVMADGVGELAEALRGVLPEIESEAEALAAEAEATPVFAVLIGRLVAERAGVAPGAAASAAEPEPEPEPERAGPHPLIAPRRALHERHVALTAALSRARARTVDGPADEPVAIDEAPLLAAQTDLDQARLGVLRRRLLALRYRIVTAHLRRQAAMQGRAPTARTTVSAVEASEPIPMPDIAPFEQALAAAEARRAELGGPTAGSPHRRARDLARRRADNRRATLAALKRRIRGLERLDATLRHRAAIPGQTVETPAPPPPAMPQADHDTLDEAVQDAQRRFDQMQHHVDGSQEEIDEARQERDVAAEARDRRARTRDELLADIARLGRLAVEGRSAIQAGVNGRIVRIRFAQARRGDKSAALADRIAKARARIAALLRPPEEPSSLPDTSPSERMLRDAEHVLADHRAKQDSARRDLVHARAQVARARKLKAATERWMAHREQTLATHVCRAGFGPRRTEQARLLAEVAAKTPKPFHFDEPEIEAPLIGDVRRALLDAERDRKRAGQAIDAFEQAGLGLDNARTLALDKRDACRFERLTEARSAHSQLKQLLLAARLLAGMRGSHLELVETRLIAARNRKPTVQVEAGSRPDAGPFRTANAAWTQSKRRVNELAKALDGFPQETERLRDQLDDLEDRSDELRRSHGRRRRRVGILESELPEQLRRPSKPPEPPRKSKSVDDLMAWVKEKKPAEPQPVKAAPPPLPVVSAGGLDEDKTTMMSPEEIARQLAALDEPPEPPEPEPQPAGLDEGKTTMMSPEELERLKKELLGD